MRFQHQVAHDFEGVTRNFEQLQPLIPSSPTDTARSNALTNLGFNAHNVTASGTITLSTTPTLITGMTFTVAQAGTYLTVAFCDVQGTATGWGNVTIQPERNGSATGINSSILGDNGTAGQRVATPAGALLACAAGDTITVLASKTSAGGTVAVGGNQTFMLIALVA